MVCKDVWYIVLHAPSLCLFQLTCIPSFEADDEQLLYDECTFQIHFIFVNAGLILNHNKELLSVPKRIRVIEKKKNTFSNLYKNFT